MKKALIVLMSFFIIMTLSVSSGFSDQLDGTTWYFTYVVKGAQKGAFKVLFENGTLSGVGATTYDGVIELGGSYAFDFDNAKKFRGTYWSDGDFGSESGTFTGWMKKGGTRVKIRGRSTEGDKFIANGKMGPGNFMIPGSFRVIVRGADRGYFDIESAPSGTPDIFYLSGRGWTKHGGDGTLSIYGYGWKGKIYGDWSADADVLEDDEGTYKGTYKNGKLKARAKSKINRGVVYRIKSK